MAVLFQLKNQRSGGKTVSGFSIAFIFERNQNVLKSNRTFILLNKNINFNKSKMKLKIQNPVHTGLDR